MKIKIPVAFVPSYCLYVDGTRLTEMSRQSVVDAAALYRSMEVDHIIISAAYDIWEKEVELKKKMLADSGVSEDDIHVVAPITSSYDEVDGIKNVLRKLDAEILYLVADSYHAERAKSIIRAKISNIEIITTPFVTWKFEKTLEPHKIRIFGKIKGFRVGYKWSWILWNKLFQILTPLKLRFDKPKS